MANDEFDNAITDKQALKEFVGEDKVEIESEAEPESEKEDEEYDPHELDDIEYDDNDDVIEPDDPA